MDSPYRPVTPPAVAAPRLSALVVAHDEEDQLAACLERLAFADELVVVLDRCTDGSEAVARRFTDRIVAGAWPVEGDRRNTGIDACTGDWILEVDADERVTPELAAEIRTAIAGAPYGYFVVPYDNYVGDRLVRYGWGAQIGVSAAIRLFARGAKRWGPQRVHPKLALDGAKMTLNARMIHHVDTGISDMLHRLDRYTTLAARDMRASGEVGTLGRNLRRIFSRFWKCYVARKGYREGRYGILIALMAALYPILSYLKATLEDE
ncbi:MAG: glycosyltransferase family 2 protein [Alphaproteobacteria bacterium]